MEHREPFGIGPLLNVLPSAGQARITVIWLVASLIGMMTIPDHLSGNMIGWLIVAAWCVVVALANLSQTQATAVAGPPRIFFISGLIFTLIAAIISGSGTTQSAFFLLASIALLTFLVRASVTWAMILAALLAPMWVWLVGDAWRWALLLLLPIVGLGLLAVSHIGDTKIGGDQNGLAVARAHRIAAWVVIALTGILIILVGMLAGLNKPWLALAGIALAISVPIEAGTSTLGDEVATARGARIIGTAYMVAACCWLFAIA